MHGHSCAFSRRSACLLVALFLLSITATARGQDLLGDNILFSGATLHLRPYVDPGTNNRLISMTTQPATTGNSDLFVSTQEGSVYAVSDDGAGNVTSTEWFNYNSAVNVAVSNASNGFVLDSVTNAHGGLRAVAFHPEFAINGKLYTSAMVDRPSGVAGINYLGNSVSGFDADSVVAEWTFDHDSGQVISSSYRELFRVAMPVLDHPVKQLAFNDFATPGDDDYGLLYIAHGDGSVASAIAGGGQNTTDALGKILRVNPLQSGADPYTTPNNPFVGIAGTLDEIYTLGHRNPHHLSFAQDANGSSHAIVSEAGRDNIEEVNVLRASGDFGWSDREGTFVHNHTGGPNGSGYGLDYGVSSLPANDWQLNDYVYPAAQYDHDSALGAGFVGSAIAGGFVIDNGSDPALQNQYLFADFGSNSGHVYQADFDDMLTAHTQLADGELPSELTQAVISRLHLAFDHDNNSSTPELMFDDLNSLLGTGRNDVRFGRGPDGEMFISSKQTGLVYQVTNSVTIRGDMNGDGAVDSDDVPLFVQALVDRAAYEANPLSSSVSPDVLGDFDGNRRLDLGDISAFSLAVNAASPASSSAVPEPSACLLFVLALVGLAVSSRRKGRGPVTSTIASREMHSIGWFAQVQSPYARTLQNISRKATR